MISPKSPSVSADWLTSKLQDPNVVVLDCYCQIPNYFPDPPMHPHRHIEGAIFCDLNDISDQHSPYPHMLPSPETFTAFARKNGIHSESHVICYSFDPLLVAPRFWWMFRVFGHQRVSVLDASLQEWQEKHYSLTSEPTHPKSDPTKKPFQSVVQPHLIASQQQVRTTNLQIVDARSKNRFQGRESEPRDIPSGHMPRAINLPFFELFESNQTLKSEDKLIETFSQHGVDTKEKCIFSCGSGITACTLAWGHAHIHKSESMVYDGSWSEWASNPENPIETS